MKISLVEPQRGYTLLHKGLSLSETYPRIHNFAPIGADIFVFIYPILLVVLYLIGIINKDTEKKEGALFIFLSCCISVICNILIQLFFLKNRPNVILFQSEIEETFLHKFLPSSSFPSDHATVSMSIAIATLLRGMKTKNKTLIRIGIFLIPISLLMSSCRVITAVHRPSDILGGSLLGIGIPFLLISPFLFPLVKRWLISPLMRLQEWVFGWFMKG